MNLEDIQKLAITTSFGLFEFTRMTISMLNTSNTFQRLMDHVLAGHDNSFANLDAILLYSKTKEEHREHLQEAFNRLRKAGLSANAEKCLFSVAQMDFLGYCTSKPPASRQDTKATHRGAEGHRLQEGGI